MILFRTLFFCIDSVSEQGDRIVPLFTDAQIDLEIVILKIHGNLFGVPKEGECEGGPSGFATLRWSPSHILLPKRRPFPFSGIQYPLADAEALGCYLQKLILIDELDCLLQAEDPGRSQLQRLVGGRRTRVGKMLRLTYVQLDILGFSVLAR